MKIAFVSSFCSHYRVKTYEALARYYDVDFYFFSQGDEWYWQKQHGVHGGNFHYQHLPGFRLGRTRYVPTLPLKLWQGNYDLYIQPMVGRFALVTTYLIARLKQKPFILWTGVWMRLGSFFHRLFLPFICYLYLHADAIVVYGEHVKRFLVSEGVPPERIFIAPQAVDNDAYNYDVTEEEELVLRRQLGIEQAKRVVLYLGRLEPGKGLEYLVEAFAKLDRDDEVLVLAGIGSEELRLRALARERGISEHVRFPGYIPTHKVAPFYALASVFVLPSVTTAMFREPWGLVVNEAFNQGTPVIATNAVGAAAGGLVRHGENGFIVPERDSDSLARALRRILDDPDLRERMSQNARQLIQGWDNERMVRGFLSAIEYVQNHS